MKPQGGVCFIMNWDCITIYKYVTHIFRSHFVDKVTKYICFSKYRHREHRHIPKEINIMQPQWCVALCLPSNTGNTESPCPFASTYKCGKFFIQHLPKYAYYLSTKYLRLQCRFHTVYKAPQPKQYKKSPPKIIRLNMQTHHTSVTNTSSGAVPSKQSLNFDGQGKYKKYSKELKVAHYFFYKSIL